MSGWVMNGSDFVVRWRNDILPMRMSCNSEFRMYDDLRCFVFCPFSFLKRLD